MPELPEVETVVRYLRPKLIGKRLRSAEVPSNYKKALVNTSALKLSNLIAGKKIKAVLRRAKYIILELDQGVLCVHLRMTGRLQTKIQINKDLKYVTAWFNFKDGSKLYFRDTRKFGKIYYYENLATLDSKLGVEPLTKDFTPHICKSLLNSHKGQLKPLLLNQKIIAGIGNIYADEILWACKLHPQKKSGSLTLKQCSQICRHTKRILNESIKRNGTTFQSFYFGEESNGEFANKLKVFDRTGKPCKRCGNLIKKIKVAQRGTHICCVCQRI